MKKTIAMLAISLSVVMLLNCVSVNVYAASDSFRGKYSEGNDDEIGFFAAGDIYYDEVYGYIVCNNFECKGLLIDYWVWYEGALQRRQTHNYDDRNRVSCSFVPTDDTMIILVGNEYFSIGNTVVWTTEISATGWSGDGEEPEDR